MTALETIDKAVSDPCEWWPPKQVAELVQQAIAAEREACAKIAEEMDGEQCTCWECKQNPRGGHCWPAHDKIAEAIRARK